MVELGDNVFIGYVNEGVTQTIAAGAIAVRYQLAGGQDLPLTQGIVAPEFIIDLKPMIGGAIVPNSLSFIFNGRVYSDRLGVLMHSISTETGVGIVGGSIDYSTGIVKINVWDGGAVSFTLLSGLINPGTPGQSAIAGRTAARPLKPSSFFITAVSLEGGSISVNAGSDGKITGTRVQGSIDIESGVYAIEFGEFIPDPESPTGPQIWKSILVDPATLRYNAVAYSYLPLDAELLGLDPVRLPSDGRVPIFRPGDYVVIGHDSVTLGPVGVSNNQTIDLSSNRLSRIRVVGSDGLGIESGWVGNLDAGTVTFIDTTGYAQPVKIIGRVEDMVRLSDAQITGHLQFTRPLTHEFPSGSVISSALMLGDQRARVSHLWDQQTWDNVWQDAIRGSTATGTYDDALFPIRVTNAGAITERWLIKFSNTSSVDVIGEHAGLIFSGSITENISPLNPVTQAPYFTIFALGFGGGWAAGNVIRINTVGSVTPIWAIQTVQQGASSVSSDCWEIIARGDVDRP